MRLYILKPVDPEGGFWDPWCDKAFGFVVRAESEEQARQLAQAEGGDETKAWPREGRLPAWTDPAHSTCEVLTDEGEAGIVLQDFHAA